MNQTKSEMEKIEVYRDKGFTSNYKMIDGEFTDLEIDMSFTSDEIVIEDEYRYEGMSNPSDMSILYILSIPNKSKGTLLLPFGPMGDGEMGWFMKEVSQNVHNVDKTTLNKI